MSFLSHTVTWETESGRHAHRRIMVDERLHEQFGERLDDILLDVSRSCDLFPGQGCTKRYSALVEKRRGISVYRKPGGKLLWLEAFPLYQEGA